MNGVLRTRVGYCGGATAHPTYQSIGDHTEGISIDYDPSVLSYSDFLTLFWKSHSCRYQAPSRQYMIAVFPRNEEQQQLAQQSLESHAAEQGMTVEQVRSQIVPIEQFTLAEKYHQKYAISSRDDLRAFLDETYPGIKSFADSTVAARLNGLQSSSPEARARALVDLTEFGLPEVLEARLRSGK